MTQENLFDSRVKEAIENSLGVLFQRHLDKILSQTKEHDIQLQKIRETIAPGIKLSTVRILNYWRNPKNPGLIRALINQVYPIGSRERGIWDETPISENLTCALLEKLARDNGINSIFDEYRHEADFLEFSTTNLKDTFDWEEAGRHHEIQLRRVFAVCHSIIGDREMKSIHIFLTTPKEELDLSDIGCNHRVLTEIYDRAYYYSAGHIRRYSQVPVPYRPTGPSTADLDRMLSRNWESRN